MIAPTGRLDGPGQPLLWSVTAEFLDHFGLTELSQLPPLEEASPAEQGSLELASSEDGVGSSEG